MLFRSQEYRRALVLHPNLDEVHHELGLIYAHIGLWDEALLQIQKEVAINPTNIVTSLRRGQVLIYQGKCEEALAVLQKIPRDINPSLVGYNLAWAFFCLGRKKEASATLAEFLSSAPEDTGGVFAAMQAVLAAAAGDARQAEDKIKSALERGKGFGHFHHTAYSIASAYALLNKPEPAIQWLRTASETGFPCYPLFERDPNLNHLRKDPRFVAFLAKLKEQWASYKAAFS